MPGAEGSHVSPMGGSYSAAGPPPDPELDHRDPEDPALPFEVDLDVLRAESRPPAPSSPSPLVRPGNGGRRPRRRPGWNAGPRSAATLRWGAGSCRPRRCWRPGRAGVRLYRHQPARATRWVRILAVHHRVAGQPDLVIALDPIATESCDHRFAAAGHDPGVKLRHLAEIRHATCTGPTCRRPASRCDFERKVPYKAGGRTCLCNGGPKCRHEHRLKQDPRWKVEQITPATFRWTTPSGRQYTTEPTRYPM